jgi:hypothetical protein
LYLLVDQVGLDHRWVQGVLIFVVAGMLFVLQKLVVFRPDEHAGSEP